MTEQEMIDKYGEEYYRNHLKRVNAHNKERYKTDSEYRERINNYCMDRYNNDPEFRERLINYRNDRYNNDPEFREKQKAICNKYCKERYNNDPEFHEKQKARCNAYNKERYCCESLEEVENYELAKANNFEGWDLHHRLEINEHGKVRFTMKQLKKLDLYYNRPASELIWLTRKEHRRMHAISRRKDV